MDQQSQPDTSGRFLQVKVLYTINDDSKTNCLARCPYPLHIQTAFLDQSTEIGLIELRTCIQAIAAASPELVAKLGHDYTVYAYDYSEYENPLVGQGMLSWILASASSTPTAPAHMSKTMVTGKVCQNALGLFSGGAKETLEVKLRLIPVPTCLQSEYLESMEKYRSAGTLQAAVADGALEIAAWPAPTQPGLQCSKTSAPGYTQQTGSSFPSAQDTLSSSCHLGSTPRPNNNATAFDPTHNTLFSDGVPLSYEHTQSRPTTPSNGSQSQTNKRPTLASRPSSRNSNRGRSATRHPQPTGSRVDMSQDHNSESEDGPRRKRAKITKTNWNGSSAFGSAGDSLRMTAAAAASVRNRNLSSTALTSDMMTGDTAERPPTPRPRHVTASRSRPIPSFPRSLTSTTDELSVGEQSVSARPQTNDPLGILAESSPEKNDQSSTGSTPVDMPSSPPIARMASPLPSSPPLSRIPFHDSGFDSENFDDYTPGYMDSEEKTNPEPSLNEKDLSTRSERTSKSTSLDPNSLGRRLIPGPPPLMRNIQQETSASSPLLPVKKNASKQRNQNTGRNSEKADNDSDAIMDSPDVVPQSLAARVALLSTVLPDDTTPSTIEGIWANDGSQHSNELREDQNQVKRARTITHEKKKQAIQDRLAESIKTGAMPRFCKNCGEIKTPSWRKAFIKIEKGDPSTVKLSEDEAGIHSWEAIGHSEDGKITSYRVVKKKITANDEGFEEIELCNSCGIWLFKNKAMRPHCAWDKQGDPKSRRKSFNKKKPDEETDTPSEHDMQASKLQSGHGISSGGLQNHRSQVQRAASLGPLDRQCVADRVQKRSTAQMALQRAIRSSPPRFPGSQMEPIEVDLDADNSPKSARRLLFPSPRRPGQIKSLDPDLDGQTATAIRKGKHLNADGLSSGVFEDKENLPPVTNGYCNEDLDNDKNDNNQLLLTPKRRISDADPRVSSNGKRRTPLTPRNPLSSGGKRRRFSDPATPSSAFGIKAALTNQEMTPFTAHIAQLLSESNGINGQPLNTYSLDDSDIFNFSEHALGEESSTFAIFDPATSSMGHFWSEGDPFSESIEAYLKGNRSPNHVDGGQNSGFGT